jgi:hypothetical protein
MKLLTQAILKKIPPLRAQEKAGDEAIIYAKFFCPWSNWTWFATEFDPNERLFFGMVHGFEKELGYFSLDELESITGPGGLKIERDMHFKPIPLKSVKD